MSGGRGVRPAELSLAQLTLAFVLDITEISRAGGHVLDPLLATAMLQANQGPILQDPALQRRYGGALDSLPDAQRRPISVNALARSLGLPYETVRRRIGRLEAARVCSVSPLGAIVTRAAAVSDSYRRIQAARVARLARLHEDLAGSGLAPASEGVRRCLDASPRAADRLLGDYMLRTCETVMRVTGDAMNGIILLGLARENLRGGSPPRPCRTSRLAPVLGIPSETVRRRVQGMAARGFCRRVPGGWMTRAAEAPLELDLLLGANDANVARLLARLALVGERAPAVALG